MVLRFVHALGLVAVAACGTEPPLERPSAVLITLDTTTPDSLDVYGTDRGATPNLKALAARSVVYDAARSVAPITLPAHTSMLTGLYPYRHTVHDNGHLRVPDAASTLAERARGAGYRTAAFLAAGVLAPGYGLDQGFEVYDAPESLDRRGGFQTRWAGEVTTRAIAWLDGRGDHETFLLWVHYFDPHWPYYPPPKFAARFPDDPYQAEVAAMDHHVGRLLARLAEERDHARMTVVVAGDHGEAFGANGEGSHGDLLHDATLRVPLLVSLPGDPRAGTRSDELVSVVDVFPTLLAALDLPVPGDLDGLDLARPTSRAGVYAENYSGYLAYGWAPLVGWAGREGLYVHGPRPAFDRWDGDGELRDITGDEPWLQETRRRLAAVGEAVPLPRPEKEQLLDADLSALGYAGGGGVDLAIPPPLDVPDLPDPRDRLGERHRIAGALQMADLGKLEEGIEELREVTRDNPRNTFAHEQLANLLLRAGRPRAALEPLRAMIAAGLERPSMRRRMAMAHALLGELDAARAELDRYEELCPEDPGVSAFREELERRMAPR